MSTHIAPSAPNGFRRLPLNSLLGMVGSGIAQLGSVLGLVTHWENTPTFVIITLVYGILTVSLIVAVGMAASSAPAIEQIRRRASVGSRWLWPLALALGALWASPLEPTYALDALRWTLTLGVMLGMVVLWRDDVRGGTRAFMATGVAVGLVWFSLYAVRLYPDINTDEGWNLNKAWSSLSQGPVYAASINLGVHGDPEQVNAEAVWWGYGQWLKAAGLGWWQGRLLSWMLMLIAATFVSRAGRNLYDPQTGILAGLMVLASSLALYAGHLVRYNSALIAAMSAALYLHAHIERRGRFADAFALGLLLALALEIHANALIYIGAFGALYLGRTIVHRWQTGHLVLEARVVGLVTGGLSGAILIAMVRILPDVVAFAEQARYHYAANYETDADATLLGALRERIVTVLNHGRSLFALSLVEGNLAIFGASRALIRGPATDRALVWLIIMAFITWGVIGARRAPVYITNLLPLLALLAAITVVRIGRTPNRVWVVGAILLAAVTGVSVRHAITDWQNHENARFNRCLASLEQKLPANAVILGEHLFWLARPTQEHYASRTLIELPWDEDRTRAEWIAWIDPDIVLWPGPVYGAVSRYIANHDFVHHDVAACSEIASVWGRPGLALDSSSRQE